MGLLDRGLEIKTPDQIDLMRRAGLLTGETLELLRAACRPGITTGELDALAEDNIRSHGGVPSFQGYGYPPFPATICASVNEEVVHGIPGGRVLVEGDVISIDCGAIVEGWHGDAAITVAIGEVAADVAELMRVTEESLWAGIAAARLGGRVTDISYAVESSIRAHGDYGILEDYVGHGIGSQMHMSPNVPNVGRAGRGPKLVPGLALGGGADGHPRFPGDRRAGRRLDGRHGRRFARGPLRAHLHPHPERRVGAHRARRRPGAARRPRCPLRRPLSRSSVESRPTVALAETPGAEA